MASASPHPGHTRSLGKVGTRSPSTMFTRAAVCRAPGTGLGSTWPLHSPALGREPSGFPERVEPPGLGRQEGRSRLGTMGDERRAFLPGLRGMNRILATRQTGSPAGAKACAPHAARGQTRRRHGDVEV